MGILLPNHNRAKAALTMICVVAALDAAAFASSYFQYLLIQKVSNGEVISTEAATANDTRQQLIAITYMIVFFASAIVFIMWFRRAYNNLHQKNPFLSFSEGWAAGCWFVPIINLYRPYQIMKEMYVETKRLLEDRQVIHTCRLETTILGVWWFLWILNSITGQIAYRMARYAESVDQMRNVTLFSMVDNALGLILAVVAVRVVKNYSEAEPLLIELREETEQVSEKIDLL